MAFFLIIAVIIIAVVVLNWFQGLKVKRRTDAMEAEAARLGLSFVAEATPGDDLLGMGDLLLFSQGRPSSKIGNVMRGQVDGVDVTIFDYTFNIPAGRYVENWRQTVVQLQADDLELPRFSLCPHDIVDAVVLNMPSRERREAILGTLGVRFDDHRDFSDRYKLMGPRRDKIASRFTDDVIAHFADDMGAVCAESEGRHLFYYEMHELVDPEILSGFVGGALALFRALSARDAAGTK